MSSWKNESRTKGDITQNQFSLAEEAHWVLIWKWWHSQSIVCIRKMCISIGGIPRVLYRHSASNNHAATLVPKHKIATTLQISVKSLIWYLNNRLYLPFYSSHYPIDTFLVVLEFRRKAIYPLTVHPLPNMTTAFYFSKDNPTRIK